MLGVTTGSLWINGVHRTAGFTVTPLSNSAPTVNVRIGAAGNTGTGAQIPFKGYIDEVTLWNKGLSSAEWVELYNTGRPNDARNHTQGVLKSLKHFYRMGDGDTYPTLIDLTGSANGTATNMVSVANFTGTVP